MSIQHAVASALARGCVNEDSYRDLNNAEDRERFAADRSTKPAFSVHDVTWQGAVKGVNFDVFRGEVLGLGGLVGAGRTELAHLAAGVQRPTRVTSSSTVRVSISPTKPTRLKPGSPSCRKSAVRKA
jgi:ABC-type sugar transport system ATPase subunit